MANSYGHQRSVRAPLLIAAALVVLLLVGAAPALAAHLTPTEQLGKALFFDTNLSSPVGQACATCHGPEVGWTGPDQSVNRAGAVYPGAFPGRFGNRKPPSAAYGGESPILYFDAQAGWVGGMFWDGRATGKTLGDPLAEQAKGPFLNPLEMNVATAADLVAKVKASHYARLFTKVWGAGIWSDVDAAYVAIGRSIAAFERSPEVSAFTSKYDAYLQGRARLTGRESQGMALFMGKAKCSQCHVPPNFTDFNYDNLGVPRNPLNPFYVANPNWVDSGLGGYLNAASENGKFKVPTLRNVALAPRPGFVKAYTHNGYFKSLRDIVHFYNTRDVGHWPPPEVAANMNTTQVGDLHLTRGEELKIVAFLKTLSDGYRSSPWPCH
ncbi:MAG TPA: cytochrome c peroxidase [Thermoleophilia bacterium]